MIRAQVSFPNPDDTVMELKIAMPVKRWRDLLAQLPSTYPSWEFANLIASAIGATVARVERVTEVES